ncbi:MAG: LacI family DNA-binding transcriptional regulator [Candidatus Omnitrophica bacterium]|nr:LacI family DNA-binding transcriptional regulator [Candidatus Omnitrophota bacterium]
MILPATSNNNRNSHQHPTVCPAVTMKEIARLANTSIATVSRVIAHKPGVRPQKREEVLDIVSRLGFKPNLFASQLPRKESRILAVMTSDLENHRNASMIENLERAANREGYELVIATSNRNPDREAEKFLFIRSLSISGLFYVSMEGRITEAVTGRLSELVEDHGLAVTVIGNAPYTPFDSVTIDHAQSAYHLGSLLRGSGRRSLLYLTKDPNDPVTRERTEGLMRAFERVDVAGSRGDLGGFSVIELPETDGTAVRQLKKLFRGKGQPAALLCDTDYVSLASIRLLERLGASIPRELPVFSFESPNSTTLPNSSEAQIPPVLERVADLAVDILIERMRDPNKATVQCKVARRMREYGVREGVRLSKPVAG